MKKFTLAVILLLTVSFAFFAYAEEKVKEVPEGMRIEKIGDLEVLMPKDAKLTKKGDVFVQETNEEYMARKFHELDERLKKIEEELTEMRKDLQILKTFQQ